MKNLKILIDTNVLLDFLSKREPFWGDATKIIKLCKNDIDGFIAAHSIVNLFYILRKHWSINERKSKLLKFCKVFHIVNIDNNKIISALENNDFEDFEDCLQDECAVAFNADYIVTRNLKDFKNSKIKALSPNEFLKIIE